MGLSGTFITNADDDPIGGTINLELGVGRTRLKEIKQTPENIVLIILIQAILVGLEFKELDFGVLYDHYTQFRELIQSLCSVLYRILIVLGLPPKFLGFFLKHK